MADLGAISDYSRATSINAHGVVVGESGRLPCTRCAPGTFFTVFDDGLRQIDLSPGGSYTIKDASINKHGQMAVATEFRAATSYLVEGGRVTGIPGLVPTHRVGTTTAWDINDRGQVVGESGEYDFIGAPGHPPLHAFLYDDGATTDLGTLIGPSGDSAAHAINKHGVVVGSSTTATGATHAVVWSRSGITDLGTLGGDTSVATDVNDHGDVVGWSATASGAVHAFVWRRGTMTDLGTLGGGTSRAAALNERGQVVGESETSDGTTRAFLWRNGEMRDLGTLGGAESRATDVNRRGQVVGYSTTATGATHAFMVK